jgi:hypothetical protein
MLLKSYEPSAKLLSPSQRARCKPLQCTPNHIKSFERAKTPDKAFASRNAAKIKTVMLSASLMGI